MKNLLYLILLLPIISIGQTDSHGIRFIKGLTWEQVKQKAKEENKFIFVDCFTTWCKPCLEMERNIYPLEKVGDYFNSKYISVKMQLDTNKKDNDEIKNRYADAHAIMYSYKVDVFPTFLFFSPDGNLVHRAAGGYDAEGFIAIAADALNPQKQYYRLIAEYRQGNRDTSVMKQLARSARWIDGKELADQIASDYLSYLKTRDQFTKENLDFLMEFNHTSKAKEVANFYIGGLTDEEFFAKDNIVFMRKFLNSSAGKQFKIFYENADKIDQIMGDKLARPFVVSVITKEEVDPILVPASKPGGKVPNWSKLTFDITKKYNRKYADLTIAAAKCNWYGFKKDWPNYTKSVVRNVELSDNMDNWYYVNESAWSIFLYSNAKSELRSAISWIEHVLKLYPDNYLMLDTYANLLYKSGKIQDGIKWEEQAIKMVKEATGGKSDYLNTFQETVDKMKKGEPTYPSQK